MSDTPTRYESGSASAVGARHAIAFGFARHALASLLVSAGMRPGDEVVLSPLTCKVVPLALLSAGLRPVYLDISPATLNLDPERLDAREGPGRRTVLFQHTYGRDAGVRDAALVAERRGWLMIEDCAQCMPIKDATYAPGAVGRAAVFSNNLLKPLPAGSGGLVTTDDDELARRIRSTRDALPVRSWPAEMKMRAETSLYRLLVGPSSYWPVLTLYRQISPSYRERPVESEIQDEIMRVSFRPSPFQLDEGARWLRRLAEIAAHRRACCADYGASLVNHSAGWDVPPGAGAQPLLYFPVLTNHKTALLRAAKSQRLPVVPWPGSTPIYPVERLDALRSYGYVPGSCPVAESVASRLIGLPTDPDITPDTRRRIAALVAEVAAA